MKRPAVLLATLCSVALLSSCGGDKVEIVSADSSEAKACKEAMTKIFDKVLDGIDPKKGIAGGVKALEDADQEDPKECEGLSEDVQKTLGAELIDDFTKKLQDKVGDVAEEVVGDMDDEMSDHDMNQMKDDIEVSGEVSEETKDQIRDQIREQTGG